MRAFPGWVESSSAVNSTAIATRGAESDKQHIVYAVEVSFSSEFVGHRPFQIRDGAAIIWSGYAIDGKSQKVSFPKGLCITPGNLCRGILSASQVPGVSGYMRIHGATV